MPNEAVITMPDTSKRLLIAVVGDIFDDQYIVGNLTRIAPEGVPVFVATETRDVPGGAANTARQLTLWNCHTETFGCCVGSKRRFVVDGKYVLRHDAESRPDEVVRRHAINFLLEQIGGGKFDAVILSDYDKGTITEADAAAIVEACLVRKLICVVDPKLKPPSAYAGCTVLKCNADYARRFSPVSPPAVITRGEDAPIVCTPNRNLSLAYKPSVHVASVVGAGDCFAAVLTASLCRGLSLAEAAEAACSAGRVYVQRPFNQPVHPLEVARDLEPVGGKIVNAASLADYLYARRPRVAFANGVFATLHPGHVSTLAFAKRQGDVLIVAVNDDASAARIKPGRERMTCAERMQVVAAIGCVDFVVAFSEDTPVELMASLGAGTVVKGPDCSAADVPRAQGWEVVIAPPCAFTRHSSNL